MNEANAQGLESVVIFFLVKFFEKEEYADAFRKGHLYLNRLSYFKKLEAGCDGGRSDQHEALSHWLQPHDVILELSVPGIGQTTIKREDLAGPVSMSFDSHDDLHLFCMYAVRSLGFEVVGDEFRLRQGEAEQLKEQLRIDERVYKFGKFAVVLNYTAFRQRMSDALKARGFASAQTLVRYYDDNSFHGAIPVQEIPFWKQQRFSYQNEYRICVRTGITGDGPLNLDIGDISNISHKFETSRLMSEFLKPTGLDSVIANDKTS